MNTRLSRSPYRAETALARRMGLADRLPFPESPFPVRIADKLPCNFPNET